MSFQSAGSVRTAWAIGLIAVAISWIAGVRPLFAASTDSITFDERVAARRAVEAVRWRHRVWPGTDADPKPTLGAVLSEARVRAKVADDLRKEAVLASEWGVTVTASTLQEELDRMTRATRRPDRLAELFAALDRDPARIAECLVKPILVDRLIRSAYAMDARIHRRLRSQAVAELRGAAVPADLADLGGAYAEIEWIRRGAGASVHRGDDLRRKRIVLSDQVWRRIVERGSVTGLPAGAVSDLREEEDRFVAVGAMERSADRLVVATVVWKKTPFDVWWAASAPTHGVETPLAVAPAIEASTANAVSCGEDAWAPTSHGPSGRFGHTSLWTGAEMIVWGGFVDGLPLDTGSSYDPATDSWSPLPTLNAPSARSDHTAVWTGSEMIVWGGWDGSAPVLGTGGRYSPTSGAWSAVSASNAPAARTDHTAVWSGGEMIVWGGSSGGPFFLDSGGRFDPGTGAWTPTSSAGAPTARYEHTAVWVGDRMIVWGGFDGATPFVDTGARYDPAHDAWGPMSAIDVPSGRWHHTAVATDDEMIVWGGEGDSGSVSTGGRYSVAGDAWIATPSDGAPSPRDTHAAVWTGNEMIVWGGWQDFSPYQDTGGRYDPAQESWQTTSITGAPEGRYGHTAVWADDELIVWGGVGSELGLDTGGRYCAGADAWVHLTLDASGTDSLLAWTAVSGAIGYDVVRGSLTLLRTTEGNFSIATEDCLLDDGNPGSLTDTDPLGSTEGYWYLVRPALPTGPGTYDSGGIAQAASRDAGVDASVHACP